MSDSISVSVLVPACNEEVHLGTLLDSIRDSFRAVGRRDYEMIVCDNNSTDATARVAEAAGARVVFEAHNQIARARNAAAAAARGTWLVFIDADSRLTPELLQRTLGLLSSGRVCGGGARVSMGSNNATWVMRLGVAVWSLISVTCRWAAGAYVFCPREAWEETGGFDERYYAGEEIAFSRRLKRWGRRRGLRFAIIWNPPAPSSPRKGEQFGPWRILGQVLICCFPGSLRRRERCGFWYARPPERKE